MLAKHTPLPQLFKIVADESRLKIICLLFQTKKICVSDVASQCKLSVAVTSHHLKVLEKVQLVSAERNGKENCYSLNKSPLIKDLKKLICTYEPKQFK